MKNYKYKQPRCAVCGQFVALGLGEGEPGEVDVEYTPDYEKGMESGPEEFEFVHKKCK